MNIKLPRFTFVIFIALSLFWVSTLPTSYSQTADESNNLKIDTKGFFIIGHAYEGQTLVTIQKSFWTDTVNKDSVLDELIDEFVLTKETADQILKIEPKEVIMRDSFNVSVNVKDCQSKVNAKLMFVIDSTDRDSILDAIVEQSALSKSRSNSELDFEIDDYELVVRTANGKTRVTLSYCDEITRFVIPVTKEKDIISAINAKTGLREYKIPQVWDYLNEQELFEQAKGKTLEETKEEALKFGETVFENAANQMEKAEQSSELAAEGGEIPEVFSEGGGGCLIATATYGSELTPEVQFLRELRDNTVLSTSSGASFMTGFNTIYYSFSPTIADWERESPVFKEVVKTTITPLLSSLTLLNHVEIDSEAEMLGYGIGVILLNIGMYFVMPAIFITQIKKIFRLIK